MMVDSKKITPPKTEKQTSAVPTARNTPAPTASAEEKADVTLEMIKTRTGQIPADLEALVGEMKDQATTEAEADKALGVLEGSTLDALTLERRDAANTLAQAMGMRIGGASNEELLKEAKERNKVIAKRSRDTSRDNVHNSRPANWVVTREGADGPIHAYNSITGLEYDGPAEGLADHIAGLSTKKATEDA